MGKARRGTGATTGDLFDHFGVEERPAASDNALPAAVAAAACQGCGWIRPVDERGPCPLCGTVPSPPAEAAPTAKEPT